MSTKNKPKLDLIPALNTLGEKVNKWYPEINSGGCCVFAVIVADELMRRGRRPQIVVGSSGRPPTTRIGSARNNVVNRNSMNEWGRAGVYFNHVGVAFRHKNVWFTYDSDGVNPLATGRLGRYSLYPGRMSVEEARLVADQGKGWNSMFNRRSIPRLRVRVKEFLETNLI